ncbi:MAG: nuclear transport factor 2 family protein [Candidatus Acidiferrales bacterium]
MSTKAMVELSVTEHRNIEIVCAALCVDYCEIVDAKDYQRMREVFAEDARYYSPAAPNTLVQGADAIVAYLSHIPAALVTQHLACNIRIHAESADAATGSCKILLFTADGNATETPDGRKAAETQRIGVYDDRYVRAPSGWRIAERRGKGLLHT